jgi:hypothetical protein
MATSTGAFGALLTRIPPIDDVLNDHATVLQDDCLGYRRRADWIDVTRGPRGFGIPRPFLSRLL